MYQWTKNPILKYALAALIGFSIAFFGVRYHYQGKVAYQAGIAKVAEQAAQDAEQARIRSEQAYAAYRANTIRALTRLTETVIATRARTGIIESAVEKMSNRLDSLPPEEKDAIIEQQARIIMGKDEVIKTLKARLVLVGEPDENGKFPEGSITFRLDRQISAAERQLRMTEIALSASQKESLERLNLIKELKGELGRKDLLGNIKTVTVVGLSAYIALTLVKEAAKK